MTPKNGGTAAPEALNELNGFFTHVCKSCVDHDNAKALCELRKPIVTGIINNDDREYEDPTAKFCSEISDETEEFEDVPTCGRKKKEFCNSGPFYKNMYSILDKAPVVEGFYVSEEETADAQKAINSLIFYFQKKCKNCVEEKAKDTLCAKKDPIYQGIFDWVSDTMKDTVATYCPPEDFVCGAKHHEHCNGDLLADKKKYLGMTPKNGGTAAPEALNELNGFFTHVCKSCIDHDNGKALCALAKPIVAGIINNDDREYEDPTAKFCNEIDVDTDTNPSMM